MPLGCNLGEVVPRIALSYHSGRVEELAGGRVMSGRVIWTVLMSRQVETAMALYEGALGWRFEPFGVAPVPGWVARGAEGRAMAVFLDTSESDFPAAPEMWLPCLAVGRLDERIRGAEALGAILLRPPMEFSGFGRVAVLRQPGGAIVGWMTPASVTLT